jgi:hypothetical protein
MRYLLRTSFTLETDTAGLGNSDRWLRWLYDDLPTRATLGSGLAVPRWSGNRYDATTVVLVLETEYENQFQAAADQLRIEASVLDLIAQREDLPAPEVAFDIWRLYTDRELSTTGDPTKIAGPHPT